MDKLEMMRETIEKVLTAYTEPPFAEEKIETEVVFDRDRDRYLLVEVGWENNHARSSNHRPSRHYQ